METVLQVLNKPVDAFRARNTKVAWGLVILTILVNSVLEPLLQYISDKEHDTFDLPKTALTVVLSIATYLAINVVIWLAGKCFGSRTSFMNYTKTWGLTYVPTLLCSIVVAITEAYFYLFWNSVVWGMVFNIVFVGILLWKTILYIIYLREVAELKRGNLVGAFILIGFFILILAAVNGYFGIKTPVL